MPRLVSQHPVSAVFLSTCLALALWGFAIEPARLVQKEYSLTLTAWSERCNGLRVAILTDLHVGSPFNTLERLTNIVATVQAARPDLILLAGDYVIHGVVGGRFVAPEAIAGRLAGLSAPAGVYAVLGNHDWWFNAARVRRALESVGIPVLEDAAVDIRTGSCAARLVGIGDFWEGRHDVRAALAAVPADDEQPLIAFTHNPDVFPGIPARVTLTIAGHTHGGQVYLPLVGRLVVPSRYGERYAIGHVVEDGRHLFVSAGTGTSILPVRFLVPPEISILTLRAASR
ncbi:MAG: metallophosphoesterase [Burkholderiales bacterium]